MPKRLIRPLLLAGFLLALGAAAHVLEFDAAGQCKSLREWWHVKAG